MDAPHKEWSGSWHARDFALKEVAGSGGMSVVHRALHGPSQGTYAVKVVTPRTSEDRKHLQREVSLSLKVISPFVVRTFGWEKVGEAVWIFMEFFQGENLKAVLKDFLLAHDRFPLYDERAYLGLFRSLALGLQSIHRAGVVHCDVKPENVLVGRDSVRVFDFGIARENFTAPAAVSGTATYMSPEQIRKEPVDQRTDLYSLGVTMYELAMGIPPFLPRNLEHLHRELDRNVLRLAERWTILAKYLGGRTGYQLGASNLSPAEVQHLFEQHQNVWVKLPGSFPYAEGIGSVILKCLEKDRRVRWSTAQQVIDEIDRFLT